jgi:hypothetical protein
VCQGHVQRYDGDCCVRRSHFASSQGSTVSDNVVLGACSRLGYTVADCDDALNTTASVCASQSTAFVALVYGNWSGSLQTPLVYDPSSSSYLCDYSMAGQVSSQTINATLSVDATGYMTVDGPALSGSFYDAMHNLKMFQSPDFHVYGDITPSLYNNVYMWASAFADQYSFCMNASVSRTTRWTLVTHVHADRCDAERVGAGRRHLQRARQRRVQLRHESAH